MHCGILPFHDTHEKHKSHQSVISDSGSRTILTRSATDLSVTINVYRHIVL